MGPTARGVRGISLKGKIVGTQRTHIINITGGDPPSAVKRKGGIL